MNTILTYTGIKFDVFNPKSEDISIKDIAHGLSLKCRFNGHCKSFYSVAQHSILMSLWELPGSAQWRLMHDAAETYITDLPRPIKKKFPQFEIIENNILTCIATRFNLPPYNINEIAQADQILLATEERDLMNNPNWAIIGPAYKEQISPWPVIKDVEALFIKVAKLLEVI